MDRERFGRVLGRGARMAAKTAYEAVDAATSPSPNPPATAVPRQPEVIPPRTASRPVVRPAVAVSPNFSKAVSSATAGVAAPLKKASRALWYELTGCFFVLFTLSFAGEAWKKRANAASAIADDRHRFYAFCVLALLFGYFSVSSFLRARKR